jgi:hypothetical protein
VLAPSLELGAETSGYRPGSKGISMPASSGAIGLNPASQAGLSTESAPPDCLVVVQAVAGSSPVAHLNPCKITISSLPNSVRWAPADLEGLDSLLQKSLQMRHVFVQPGAPGS